MFNTVTKYFWGGSTDYGQEYADKDALKQQHGTGEHLEIQQEEEDWLFVNADDKENIGEPGHHLSCQHSHHHLHGYSQPSGLGENDCLSQNSSTASDAELLDDAAALAQSISTSDVNDKLQNCSDSILCPLHDFGWKNQDFERYSDTESLPESVFSASSGRSHATYHPCGSRSEPWVVAPPPCFTGSQVGGLSPIASSPLENLLIEHPSMSVYLSFPPTHPILSNRPLGEVINADLKEEIENTESSQQQLQINDDINEDQNDVVANALQPRNIHIHAAVHPGLVLQQRLLKNVQLAQRMQIIKTSRVISKNKCQRQNKAREFQSHTKGNNQWRKQMCPSGFKSSRFSQHM